MFGNFISYVVIAVLIAVGIISCVQSVGGGTHPNGRSAVSAARAPELRRPLVERSDAILECERQAKLAVPYPSTVDFAWLSANARYGSDGDTTIFTTFRARNAFNVPETFFITCTVSPNGVVEAAIVRGAP